MECLHRASPTRLLSLWTLLIACFNIAAGRCFVVSRVFLSKDASTSAFTAYGPAARVSARRLDALKVSAVTGGEATLPCDISSSQPADSLLLVVWYKDDVPIYSYDGRARSSSAHWADDSLAGRAVWRTTQPTALRIRSVMAADRALYRCRVDFKVTPTRNQKIVLDVIELPEKPKVFDERDKEVVGVAGPYVEDSSLKLTCAVSGGKPMPRVRWWRDDKVVATLAPIDDGSHISLLELKIPRLTRDYLEAVYICTADNTPLVPPLRVNVQIQLYLRPLLVEIMAREQPLSVGREAELACRAIGARPPAIITWWLNGKQMIISEPQKNSEDANETVSFFRWTPQMENNGQTLTCRALHVQLLHTSIETSMTLNLHYAPIVELKLGSELNPNDIEEGDDVYFECIVRANPRAYKVVWEHNGQIMTQKQRAAIFSGSAHLALQRVSREQAGKYVCTASNVEGDGSSPPINLQVIYKPVCTNPATAIVGAAINEVAKVSCEVDAFPPPKNFQWSLNNSRGTFEIEQENNTVDNNGRSILSYTPLSEAGYGTLSCRATNLAGQQVEPCRYSVLPAVRPDPPFNCSTFNLTDDSVELRCIAGYDGGLLTVYFVEVWEFTNLIANVSTLTPNWKLRSLGSGKSLKLVFYAYNARGRSPSTSLRLHTPSRLALHTEAKTASAGVDASWALGIVAGTGGTLAVVAIIALLARRRHHRPLQYEAPSQTVKAYKASIQSANHSPIQPDDKNPDVVPLGKDFHCTREVERPPEPPPYGSVVTPPVGASRSNHSLQQNECRSNTPHTPNTPASDVQSIGTLAEDRRSVTSGTLSRRREVVTTRTPLLANARESCV